MRPTNNNPSSVAVTAGSVATRKKWRVVRWWRVMQRTPVSQWFLSKDERLLYPFFLHSLLLGVIPFLSLQLLAFVLCSYFFLDFLTQRQLWLFGGSLFVFSAFIVAHNLLVRTRHWWLLPDGTASETLKKRALIWLACYFVMGYTWWSMYVSVVALHAPADEVNAVLMVEGVVAIFAISFIGVFIRVFGIGVIIGTIMPITAIWYVNPAGKLSLFVQIAISGILQILLLWLQHRQLVENMRIRGEHYQLVDNLRDKKQKLEKINLAQSRYLSAVSHDLRQPLHALALIAHGVVNKNKNTEIQPSLERMEHAIDSLSQSFDSMLNLSRLNSGVIKPQLTDVAVQFLFDRVALEFEQLIAQKALRFRVIPTRVVVRTDAGLLYSILSNLVSNAIRYTEQGGIVVGVRGGDRPRICVYDTGVGIDEDKIDSVFVEYERLYYARKKVTHGVGLGLAIAKRQAQLMDTQIEVRSVKGRGSVFSVGVHKVSHEQIQQGAVVESSTSSQIDYLAQASVLLLDDDAVLVASLEGLLSSWGMNTLSFNAPSNDVFSQAKAAKLDLVISDYHLGSDEFTGLDVLIRMRTIYQKSEQPMPCLVLLTGDTTADLVSRLNDEGMVLMHKPIRPAKLRSQLDALLKARAQASNRDKEA